MASTAENFPEPAADRAGRRRILLVDDEEGNVVVLAKRLARRENSNEDRAVARGDPHLRTARFTCRSRS